MGERTLGDTQVTKLFLEHGANSRTEKGAPIFQIFSHMHCGVNKTYCAQTIPLTRAIWGIRKDRLPIVKLLVENGADLNDRYGETLRQVPLMDC
ncbi:hypothetical protein TNCV_1087421 [Trichonephila clavipes]|nr:hypothetical protein TNCV_1087421 [Trichonephila clavipes]